MQVPGGTPGRIVPVSRGMADFDRLVLIRPPWQYSPHGCSCRIILPGSCRFCYYSEI